MGAIKKSPVIPPVPHLRDLGEAGEDLRARGIRADLPAATAPLLTPVRENNGRFKRGAPSPNPGGRPAVAPEVREAARAYTAEMLGVLVNVAMDEGAPAAARVTAATAVLDRGHGKPTVSVDAKVETIDPHQAFLEALIEINSDFSVLDHNKTPAREMVSISKQLS